jgi:hypothetical protein
MASASEAMRLTGIDMHQGASAPEHPRLPRSSLTFSDLPPAAWQTICTRERGVARQTLGREVRIEDSSILIECVPDAREPRHRDYFKEAVKQPWKTCGSWLTQRREEAPRPPQAAQTASNR